ncbi:MAG TPA: hypothetical protein VF736_12875 [Pyrinomonadaceae bacterium]|jgi:hypothetical protein
MRSRAAAGLLLLVLTAHAFVAGTTHFHRAAVGGAQPAQASLDGGDSGGRGAPLAGDETQCLLCRLQRNLVSESLNGALPVAPPPAEPRDYAAPRDASARASRAQSPRGRAPPSA